VSHFVARDGDGEQPLEVGRSERALKALSLTRGRQGERDAFGLELTSGSDGVAEAHQPFVVARVQQLRIVAPDNGERREWGGSSKCRVGLGEAEALNSCYLSVADVVAVKSEDTTPGDFRQRLGVDERSIEVKDHRSRLLTSRTSRTNVLNDCRKHAAD